MNTIDTLTKRILVAASVGHFAVAVLHYSMPFAGPWVYEYFGAPELAAMARSGSSLPAIATIALAVTFTICGCMGLCAAGFWRSLGIIRPLLWAVGTVYVLRGLLIVVQIPVHVRGGPVHLRDLLFSTMALIIGVVQLWGLWRSRLSKSPPPQQGE